MQALLKANDSMIEAATKLQAKKPKLQAEGGGAKYFETVAMKLHEMQHDIRNNYDDAGIENIEVEVRFFFAYRLLVIVSLFCCLPFE
jgi:hypothetical protein